MLEIGKRMRSRRSCESLAGEDYRTFRARYSSLALDADGELDGRRDRLVRFEPDAGFTGGRADRKNPRADGTGILGINNPELIIFVRCQRRQLSDGELALL